MSDPPRPGAGFSLVEIMVALATGLLLMAGIGQVYLATKQTYTVQEQLSRLQENARYALDRMGRDIRMAGSLGCTSQSPATVTNTLNANGNPFYDFGTRLAGYEAKGSFPGERLAIPGNPQTSGATAQWNPRLPAALPTSMVLGNDILLVRGRADSGVPDALQSATPDTVTVAPSGDPGQPGLQPDDFVMVADCSSAYVFQNTGAGNLLGHAAGGNPGNATTTWSAIKTANLASLQNPHGSLPAEVYRVASTLYYLSRADSDPGTSLYRKPRNSGTNTPGEAVVEGVENMQLVYGVQNGNGTLQYSPASSIADWNRVVSVRIALLLRSVEDNVRKDPDAELYDLNGTWIDPADDRRLRQVFTATIALRNGIRVQ